MPILTDENKKKWFYEECDDAPGQGLAIEIEEILYEKPSQYQDILVFKSKSFGNILVLDEGVQCTEWDEFAYQEMGAFLPLLAHPNPKRVLVIGGGDGGIIREVSKHPQVEEVVLCELDQDVIDVSKKYFPNMAKGFASPKAKIIIGDGVEYLKQHPNEFDVIISDSSDPDDEDEGGPANSLFEEPYYLLMKAALKQPHGILCAQAQCIWFDMPIIKKLMSIAQKVFPTSAYGMVSTPTYSGGTHGFILCGVDKNTKLTEPVNPKLADELGTKYYTAAIHRGCFALPKFLRTEIDSQKAE